MRRAPVLLVLLLACHESAPGTPPPTDEVRVLMDFTRRGFFDAPFPSDDLAPGGVVKVGAFPNPEARPLVTQSLEMLAGARGFSLAGGIFFRLSGTPGPLPDVAGSVDPSSPVFLVDLSDGQRTPLEVYFREDGGPFGAARMLALVPMQGFPLRPKATCAAVILRSLGDSQGRPLGMAPEVVLLRAGVRPPSLSPEATSSYADALQSLERLGVPGREIAGLAVFTTGDPTAQTSTFRDDVLSRPPPTFDAFAPTGEVFDDYCVFSSAISMPDYQTGTTPYTSAGGGWTVDPSGKPVVDHSETAKAVVTVPRRTAGAGGYPLVVFVRTGGGGDRPLVDRGPQDASGATLQPGTGPALHFARAGYAAISVDGPLGGLRNTTHGDEQYLVFNVGNGVALRDNVRESALELMLVAHLVDRLTLDSSSCPGASPQARFDMAHLALMGHSTGAWIAQLVLSLEPRYRAAVLSGAGSSWLANILYKEKPLAVAPIIALFLAEEQLSAADPALTIIQWAAEPADPQVYLRGIVREPAAGQAPRHVLMEQGIVDHYIMPRIANSTSLGMGLDLAGTPLDSGIPGEPALPSLLPLANRAILPLPLSGNVSGTTTAIVIQHPADGIQDGHEVVFQTEAPKHEYRCFLESFLAGVPRVPSGTRSDAPCQ